MMSRRTFARAVVAGVPLIVVGRPALAPGAAAAEGIYSTPPLAAGSNALIAGVRMGAQTYSFHDVGRSGDETVVPMLIQRLREVGLTDCELMASQVERVSGASNGWWIKQRLLPTYEQERLAAREWRLTVPMSYFEDIRRRFGEAGLSIFIYNLNFNDSFTDEEIDRTFLAAKALGAQGMNGSGTVSAARQAAPFAEKHGMFFAVHNHNNIYDPEQLATPESFERSFAISPWIKATLDIGHYAAGDNDPYEFLLKHHDRIVSLHIRDREATNGPHVELGKGAARVADVLRLVRDRRWPIRCYIELEYGTFLPPVEEVKRALAYCRSVLA